MDERVLAERLITYDTSNQEALRAAAGFVKGWLESREIVVTETPERCAMHCRVGCELGETSGGLVLDDGPVLFRASSIVGNRLRNLGSSKLRVNIICA